MLKIDLEGRRALVAGVADDVGFGFAIAKQLAEAGASVCVGTWPPAYGIFTKMLARGRMAESLQLQSGAELEFERIYPLDAEYDTFEEVPAEVRENRRYKSHGDFTIQGLADRLVSDFGEQPLDIVVHSIANGPEVRNPLIETSRDGYLRAISQSSYSFVSMIQRLAPLVRRGGSFMALSFAASERAVPGYGGGMSSAKAALESDTRLLAWEAGRRYGVRINCISAGAWASRAASAVGTVQDLIAYSQRNAPLPESITAEEVGHTAAFLASPLGSGITGTVVYVDKGIHAMGIATSRLDG